MDLRLLEYFVAVAELEHVGRAAERLHVSQSPLSRQIRQLEAEVGLELFIREKQRIRLSETGRWLLGEAQGLLGHAERVREEAQDRSRGRTGTLYVAFTSAAMWSGALPKALRRFQARFPGATLQLHNMRSLQQVTAVRSGSIDIGFTSMPARDRELEIACVSEESSLLVMPKTHTLSRKHKILPRDLQGVRWILLSESHSAARSDLFIAAFANAGFLPEVVQRVTEPVSLLALVESGLGVGLIRSSARNYAPRSLGFRALPWLGFKARTYMIRPAGGRQPLAEAFALSVLRGVKPQLAAQFRDLPN